MTKKEKALLACEALEKIYPDVECSLNFTKPYELMIATRLSAQCTDARVNIVTETLFKKYPTLESFAEADLSELEEVVKPCGFYHTKAKSMISLSMISAEKFRRLWKNFLLFPASDAKQQIFCLEIFTESRPLLPTHISLE